MEHSYNFTQEDLDFAIQLAKIGNVHLYSSQVKLSSHNTSALNFKESFPAGIKFPKNWGIEYMNGNERGISVTFNVTQENEIVTIVV